MLERELEGSFRVREDGGGRIFRGCCGGLIDEGQRERGWVGDQSSVPRLLHHRHHLPRPDAYYFLFDGRGQLRWESAE
jgi:hypothetical protein